MCIKAHNVLQAHRAKVYGSLKHAYHPDQDETSSDLLQEMLLWELTNEIKDITLHTLYLAAIDSSITAVELLQCFQSPEQTIEVDDTLSEGDMEPCDLDDVWIEDESESEEAEEEDSEIDPAASLPREQEGQRSLRTLPRGSGSLHLDTQQDVSEELEDGEEDQPQEKPACVRTCLDLIDRGKQTRPS